MTVIVFWSIKALCSPVANSLHPISPSPLRNILNIKQLFLLCPLHNCHRHLEPYVPVWCTPWKSGECQNMVYRVSLNSHRKSSMTGRCTPHSSRDGNLPWMLGKEPTEYTLWHLLFSFGIILIILLTSLLMPSESGQFFLTVLHSYLNGKSQMIEMRSLRLNPSAQPYTSHLKSR